MANPPFYFTSCRCGFCVVTKILRSCHSFRPTHFASCCHTQMYGQQYEAPDLPLGSGRVQVHQRFRSSTHRYSTPRASAARPQLNSSSSLSVPIMPPTRYDACSASWLSRGHLVQTSPTWCLLSLQPSRRRPHVSPPARHRFVKPPVVPSPSIPVLHASAT